ncbi:hypothetical protein [Roseateles violae]|uniref:DUF2946 domain-containing protein n=1 Tax=Roseateles violae TaxID=3058042 RepID=A0ABT8DW16_9BURK|nr:hypothetical protein [Pelomonas sp. PFR6]MDN3920356.1 hypothetical protein [Pelomonas sp. PFR6]
MMIRKVHRLLLLLLLIVLLPIRGVIAAAMPCQPLPVETTAPAQAAVHHCEEMPAADRAQDDASAQGEPCPLCAAFCSMTSMPTAGLQLAPPLLASTARFAEPLAKAPSFLSDGQERPPRTI